MIDENMVERVARALAATEFGSDDLDEWMTRPAFADGYRTLARAAIEEMNLDTIPIVDMKDLG